MADSKLTVIINEKSRTSSSVTSTVGVYYYGDNISSSGTAQSGSLTAGGNTYSFTHSYTTSTSAQLLYETDVTVNFTGGSATLSASATFVAGGAVGTLTAVANRDYTASASTLSVTISAGTQYVEFSDSTGSNINRGKLVFTISPASSNYSHVIQACSSSQSSYTDISTCGAGVNSATWTLPYTWADQFTSGESLMIRLQTYNGSVLVGTSYLSAIPVKYTTSNPDMRPTASLTITDAEGYYQYVSGYVVGQSKLSVSAAETFYADAYGVSRYVVMDGETYPLTYNSSTGKYEATMSRTISSTTQEVEYHITDSRGASNTISSGSLTCYDYYLPKILSGTKVERSTDAGVTDAAGAYITVTYNLQYASTNNWNSPILMIKYKKPSDADYTTAYSGSVSATATGTKTFAADTSSTYEVQLILKDAYASEVIKTYHIGMGYVLVDFRNTGKGIALGQLASADGFTCGMNATFGGTVTLSGAPTANLQAATKKYVDDHIKSFGSVTEVTNSQLTGSSGWTPTSDGFLTVTGEFASSNTGHLYIKSTLGGSTEVCVYANNTTVVGQTIGGTVPVHSGWTYKIYHSTASGVWSTVPHGYFMPLA